MSDRCLPNGLSCPVSVKRTRDQPRFGGSRPVSSLFYQAKLASRSTLPGPSPERSRENSDYQELTRVVRDPAKSLNEAVSCYFIAAGDVSGVSADGRRARAER
jgi:hypothetical protein